eukprot:PITA_04284
MVEEYTSIMQYDVLEVEPRPTDREVVGSRWIYKIKHGVDGIYSTQQRDPRVQIEEGLVGAQAGSQGVGEVLIRILYVDDLFLTSSLGLIEECKRDLAAEFEMKDLRSMHYFLGMEVWQTDGDIFLGQGKYCIEILRRFGMEDCKEMSTPMITNFRKVDTSKENDVDPTLYKQLIGSLMYLVNTMPNISFAVNSLSQFMVELMRVHWAATKHVLHYLQGTIEYGIKYTLGDGVRLMGYTDTDYAGSTMDRKSISVCCFSMGSGVMRQAQFEPA